MKFVKDKSKVAVAEPDLAGEANKKGGGGKCRSGWRVGADFPFPLGEGSGKGLCSLPRKRFEFGALKWHVVVHSGALL